VSAPKVYSAINAVAAELARTGIGKLQTNQQEQYQFRGLTMFTTGSPLPSPLISCVSFPVCRSESAQSGTETRELF
jgi:hypothetical protein